MDCFNFYLAFSNPSNGAHTTLQRSLSLYSRDTSHTGPWCTLTPLRSPKLPCRDYSSWALNEVRCGGWELALPPSPSFQRVSLSALNKWLWHDAFPGRTAGLSLCLSLVAVHGLRVSDVGEVVGSLGMFVFSVPISYRRFSQKTQDEGEQWQSNTHFSGVHQHQHVKAFHVGFWQRTLHLVLLFAPELISVTKAGASVCLFIYLLF